MTQSTSRLSCHIKLPRGEVIFSGKSARYTGAAAPGITIFLKIKIFLFYLKENGWNTLFNGESSFMTRHISVNVAWMDMIDDDILSWIFFKSLMLNPRECTHTNFGNAISGIWPAFFLMRFSVGIS